MYMGVLKFTLHRNLFGNRANSFKITFLQKYFQFGPVIFLETKVI